MCSDQCILAWVQVPLSTTFFYIISNQRTLFNTEGQSQKITRQTSNDETADNSSTSTQTSDTCLDQQQKAKSRGRRFSWEEIINLDTAEHIATRLIERHIDVRTTLFRKNTKLLTKATVNIPNLRQLEHAIQKMEYYEYMQTYYELRSGGLLEKYLAEALKKFE